MMVEVAAELQICGVRTDSARLLEQADGHLTVYGVPWERYLTLREIFDELGYVKMTYLEGTLELMNPSPRHELNKKLIARLLEVYALERDVDLTGYGSTTFRREAVKRGIEPDECYCIGELKNVPDIAIEVVLSSGLLDKLAVYEGLGVPEVWVWESGRLIVHLLTEDGYVAGTTSAALPNLDFAQLASFIGEQRQTAAVRAYQAALRKPTSPDEPK